jgi:Coenzyme PQQ synthesis protein D (PqqD)
MGETLQLRTDGLEWRTIDGEVVALDTRASRYLAINDSGAIIWPVLADGATRAELIAQLQERYGVDAEVAAADVDAFVGALREQDLLEQSA